MCNPALLIGMQAAGGVLSYASQKDAGESQKNYYNYLAAANEVQAQDVQRTAETQVGMIQDSAKTESVSLKNLGKRFEGAQKVAFAANGVPLSSVTAEDVAKDTMTKEQLDQAALRYNADSKSWETKTAANATAKNLREQAVQFQYAGVNAQKAADIGATTSLLSSATSVGNTWYQWNQTSKGKSPKKIGTGSPTYPSNYDRAGGGWSETYG